MYPHAIVLTEVDQPCQILGSMAAVFWPIVCKYQDFLHLWIIQLYKFPPPFKCIADKIAGFVWIAIKNVGSFELWVGKSIFTDHIFTLLTLAETTLLERYFSNSTWPNLSMVHRDPEFWCATIAPGYFHQFQTGCHIPRPWRSVRQGIQSIRHHNQGMASYEFLSAWVLSACSCPKN